MVDLNDMIELKSLDPDLQKFILKKNNRRSAADRITYAELLNFRFMYINHLLSKELKSTDEFNAEYRVKVEKERKSAKNLNKEMAQHSTFGEKMADHLAKYAGSWPFIILFLVFLVAWMFLNVTGIFFHPFDKYPFILLNLALSCLAALQAPIIMMSQNRQAMRDRMEAENDYQTNLKSEVEISLLHEKIDYLMSTKWEHIIALQQLQIELLAQLKELPISPEAVAQSQKELLDAERKQNDFDPKDKPPKPK